IGTGALRRRPLPRGAPAHRAGDRDRRRARADRALARGAGALLLLPRPHPRGAGRRRRACRGIAVSPRRRVRPVVRAGRARARLTRGARRSAENTLIHAAHAAIKKGGQRAAVPLQRGLARILLAAGERVAAIEAYRGILAVEPEGADDRVALAEIYAMEDVPKAIVECHRVLDRDLRQPPAYRLLAALYERLGEPERASRVNSIFELLGYAEEN